MRLAPVLGLTVGLSVGACGGSVEKIAEQQTGGTAGAGGTAGNGGVGAGGTGASAGMGGSGGSEIMLTSYDLEFVDVRVPDAGRPVLSPSLSTKVRLDLRAEGAGLAAVAMPRWGEPVVLDVAVEPNRLVLTGELVISRNDVSPIASETWRKLVIPRTPGGKLSVPIEATGVQDVTEGDVAWHSEATAQALIDFDKTPPEFDSMERSDHGPHAAFLPWDSIPIRAAEGVIEASLLERLRFDLDRGTPSQEASISIAWELLPAAGDASAWAGSVRALGHLERWPDLDVSGMIGVAAGVSDRVGLLGHAVAAPVQVMSFSAIEGRNDFSNEVPQVGTWGVASLLGISANPDPLCDNRGCMEIGPFDNGFCAERSGFAGRLVTSAPAIAVRYRLLFGQFEDVGEPPSIGSYPFTVDTARFGSPAQSTQVAVDATHFEALPEPTGKLRWATPWTTVNVPAPAAGDTGYAVYVEPCGFNQGAVRTIPTALLVDWIMG
jgi:hypothetical protein